MQLPRSALIRDLVCCVLIVIVYFAVALPRYRIGIDWADEGFLACGAARVIDRQVPNRDFVSVQAPLSFYTVALVFKLFGTSLLTVRWFGVFVHVCLGVLIYLISRQFVRPIVALAAALPTCVLGLPVFAFAPFAIWQGLVTALAAMLFYLRAVLADRRWSALGSGILTAVAFALRQDQGAYITLAILLATLALALGGAEDRPALRLNLLSWLAGFGAAALLFVAWSVAAGALEPMWRQLVVFPLTTYGKTSATPFPRWDSALPLARNLLTLVCYLPLILPFIALVRVTVSVLRGRFDRIVATAAFLAGWSLLAYCELLTRSDLQHFLPALPVFMVLAAFLFEETWRNSPTSLGRGGLSIAAVLIGVYVWYVAPAALSDPRQAGLEPLALPRGGTLVPRGKWITDFIAGVQRYVPADRPILALPYEPLFYFLCDRHNPTYWNYLWPGDQSAEDHAELIAQARRDPPAVIFITNEAEMSKYASDILEYVHGEYKEAGKFGQLIVYFPNNAVTR